MLSCNNTAKKRAGRLSDSICNLWEMGNQGAIVGRLSGGKCCLEFISCLPAPTVHKDNMGTVPPIPAAGNADDLLERGAHNPTAPTHKTVTGERHQICSSWESQLLPGTRMALKIVRMLSLHFPLLWYIQDGTRGLLGSGKTQGHVVCLMGI